MIHLSPVHSSARPVRASSRASVRLVSLAGSTPVGRRPRFTDHDSNTSPPARLSPRIDARSRRVDGGASDTRRRRASRGGDDDDEDARLRGADDAPVRGATRDDQRYARSMSMPMDGLMKTNRNRIRFVRSDLARGGVRGNAMTVVRRWWDAWNARARGDVVVRERDAR